MWIHLDCDRMLSDKMIRDKFVNIEALKEETNENQSGRRPQKYQR